MLDVKPTGQRGRTASGNVRNGPGHIVSSPSARYQLAILQDAAADTTCEVCFVAPREGFALVPCGHARYSESCANRVAVMDTCPVCRSNITMVIVRDVYTYRVLGICPVPEHVPRKSPPRTSARFTYTGGSCLR